jgi:hypothetical protein
VYVFLYTVKPALRSHFRTKKKWPDKTGDLLNEVQYIWNFLWQDKKRVTFWYRWLYGQVFLWQDKGDLLIQVTVWAGFSMTGQGWPFDTGDCLIEVTTWADLTVYIYSDSFLALNFHGVVRWYKFTNNESVLCYLLAHTIIKNIYIYFVGQVCRPWVWDRDSRTYNTMEV